MNFKNLVIIPFLIFAFFGCDKKDDLSDQNASVAEVFDENKPFILKFEDNTTLKFQKQKNHLKYENKGLSTLFVFCTSWDTPCEIQFKILNSLNEKFAQNLQIFAIFANENFTQEQILNFKKERNLKFKFAFDGEISYFQKTFGGVSGVPYFRLYDNEGKFLKEYFGLMPEEILSVEIERIL